MVVGSIGAITWKVTYHGLPRPINAPTYAYCQVFRSGAIEAVVSDIVRTEGNDASKTRIASLDYYEPRIMEVVGQSVRVLEQLGSNPPVFVLLSLIGVKGAYGREDRRRDYFAYPFDRDIVMAPEVMIESFRSPLAAAIRPALDALWNAAGYRGSPNFKDDGTFINRQA